MHGSSHSASHDLLLVPHPSKRPSERLIPRGYDKGPRQRGSFSKVTSVFLTSTLPSKGALNIHDPLHKHTVVYFWATLINSKTLSNGHPEFICDRHKHLNPSPLLNTVWVS